MLWLTDERMKVLRHHDITNDNESISSPDLFKDVEENISPLRRA